MGFYPVFSNINHSCISNSRVIKDKTSMKVEVRAKRDIKVLNLNNCIIVVPSQTFTFE